MATPDGDCPRTITLSADSDPFPVVFEMLGHAVVVEPFQSLRLSIRGAPEAGLTIGHGQNGVSVFRDETLEVEVYDQKGKRLEIPGW